MSGPSLRTRLVRRLFVVALRAMRELGAGGSPGADAAPAELEEYGLRLRAATERLLSMVPIGRDVEVAHLGHAPVAGRALALRVAGAPPDEPVGSARRLAAASRIVLHLHGGAYVMGSSRTHLGLGAAVARAGEAVVVLPDYRLVPEHPYPAALDDAEATWRWLTSECGVAPERIALTGDSAGGGLAAALLVRLRDRGVSLPACYAGLSPWLDLAGTGRSMVEMASADPWLSAAMIRPAALSYAGKAALDHPEVSPLYADLSGLPPMLLHVGGDEILRDDALRFAAKARAAGVDASAGVFPGLWHVFQAFPGLPEGQAAIAEVGGFIRRHTVAASRNHQGAVA
ncbi:MAG: alpha/beta hydrolase [Nitriliruptoraceae bacterium]